jgi:hypothetical protein
LSSRHQKGKDSKKVQAPHGLLVVLRLLIIVGGLLINIVVVNTSRTNTKSSQLSWSQRGIRVGDWWEDRDIKELKEWLSSLTVYDLLVAPNNLYVLLHYIHVLVCAMAHGEDTSEHLQKPDVGAGGRGGIIPAGSVRRSHIWSRRTSTRILWILGHCEVKGCHGFATRFESRGAHGCKEQWNT